MLYDFIRITSTAVPGTMYECVYYCKYYVISHKLYYIVKLYYYSTVTMTHAVTGKYYVVYRQITILYTQCEDDEEVICPRAHVVEWTRRRVTTCKIVYY